MATASTGESVERKLTLTEKVFAKREFGVIVAILGLVAVGMLVRADVFLTLGNLSGVLRNAAVTTIIGYGMAILITSGEFDLSVGSVMAFSAGLTAVMLLEGFSIWFIFFAVALLAVLYGVLQGILVTKLGLPSLIVTIGTLTLLRGGHLALLGNVTQTVPSDRAPLALHALGGTISLPFTVLVPFTSLELFAIPDITYAVPFVHESVQTFDRIPLQIFWVIVLGAIFHYVLFYTVFGYRARATGGEITAAEYTGIRTSHVKIIGFVLVALMAAFAGIGQLAFTGNVSPLTGDGQELVVIAAVVIGGTDLFGGEGTIVGTVLGALVFAFTQNILVLAGFGTQLFSIFTGIFIIFAVAVDAITRRARYEEMLEQYVDPVKRLAGRPGDHFRYVKEHTKGIEMPVTFVTFTTLAWMLPLLGVVVLTIVGNPLDGGAIIPFGFSLFVVESGVGAFGMLPLFALVVAGTTTLLTVLFVHPAAKAAGGVGRIDETVQTVAYAFAPLAFLWVPLSLLGLRFVDLLVYGTVLPIVAGVSLLLVVGLEVLHELDRTRALGVSAATGVLWLLTVLYVGGQVA